MDIDLTTSEDQISWEQDQCPWNREVGAQVHRCAIKNTSICIYFCGIEYLDKVLCSYPHSNPNRGDKIIKGEVDIKGPFLSKSGICEPVIRSLPEWFGIEEANRRYLEDIDASPTFLALVESKVVGFLTLKEHGLYTAEIQIMAVLPGLHRRGIGSGLLDVGQDYLRSKGIEYLQVKTLSASHPDGSYILTRAFYHSRGFRPLEEFPDLWGEENPCLQMVKSL
jgi:ribosomal protein S18 acetylase RimI-like enzyme